MLLIYQFNLIILEYIIFSSFSIFTNFFVVSDLLSIFNMLTGNFFTQFHIIQEEKE